MSLCLFEGPDGGMDTPLGRKLNVGRRSISNERWPLLDFTAGSSGILCMEPSDDKGRMARKRRKKRRGSLGAIGERWERVGILLEPWFLALE